MKFAYFFSYSFSHKTHYLYFFFWIQGNITPRKAHFVGPGESKTPTVSGSYKRCTLWLELQTCCADLKLFTITLQPLKTPLLIRSIPHELQLNSATSHPHSNTEMNPFETSNSIQFSIHSTFPSLFSIT